MRSLRFIQHRLWCACASYAVLFAVSFGTSGCEQFDPVRTKDLCDGPGTISMRCPQCLQPKLDPRCSACQRGEVDAAMCDTMTETDPAKNPGRGGTGAPKAGEGESGNGGESGAGEGGAGASGTDGGEGQAGESGSGGMTPAGGQGGASATPNVCDELSCAAKDAQRPHCDTSKNRCVECVENGHCGANRVCNPDLQRCQDCMVDSDCSSNACDESTHVCVNCKKDEDCQVGDPLREKGTCDRRTFTCVDCVEGKGCPDPVLGTCEPSTSTCIDCMSSLDCNEDGKPACDPTTRACVECMANVDCQDPVAGSCDKPKRKCVDCLDDTGCGGTANPHCAVEAQKCVQCVDDGQCPSKHCYAQKCVQCEADADCTGSDKARCDLNTHTCATCTNDAQCERFDDTPVCSGGKCVECNNDSTCGDKSCIRAQHVCSDVKQKSVDVCLECAADSMCKDGLRCVPLDYSGESLGNYCVVVRARANTSCNSSRPYTQTITRTSVDGTSGTLCIPPSTTSCPGVLSVTLGASGDLCEVNKDCGAGIEDGVCINKRCTYACEGQDVNCPVNLSCLTNGFCG